MSLNLPPLRERQGDIPLLVAHFLGAGWKIEPEAVQAIERYRWPGNIRQLMNAIERAKILADDHTILIDDLPPNVIADSPAMSEAPLSDELASLQRNHVVDILRRERGNKARAARALGVNRRSLYRMLEKYAIHESEHV